MNLDEILDDLAKHGFIDGNIVARISAAHKREIAEAVNGRAALRDIVRQLVDTLEQVIKYAGMTVYLRETVMKAQREACKALEGAE